jgi:hypothetical protein
MARRKPQKDPFTVPISKEQRTTLGNWLGNEIRNADMARQANSLEVEYWRSLYEQARTRASHDLPWPDAADLTSYIPCEKVDAIHARMMRTVYVTPMFTVEGYGASAQKAPFVEEFHQWKVEEERFQSVCDRVILTALVEPRCLLEIYESTARRPVRKQMEVKPETTDQGGVVFTEQGQPDIRPDPNTGEYAAASPNEIGVTTVVDSRDVIRTGPQYRVLGYNDSLILPGHATHRDEIWGYGKKIYKRKIDLLHASEGDVPVYDKESVASLTDVGERQPNASLMRANQNVAPQQDRETAEKELWELLLLIDLNDLLEQHHQDPIPDKAYDEQRWYVITIHLLTNTVIRVAHDDFQRSRYVPFILFPRSDRATEGYSLVGHKLLTVTEEHTAYRNMAADRSSMAVNAPIKKVSGALWDEDEQPWGPKAVITVRDHREIEQQQITDVPNSVYQNIAYCDRTAERLAGVNDIASGQVAQQDRTLGEVQMATEQSFVRMDLITRRFQEALEDVGQIRHEIWKRCVAEQPYGVDAPDSMMVGLEGRGVPIDRYLPGRKITAALLDGAFRFRPYGSVETANPAKRRQDLLGFIAIIPRVMQMYPQLAQKLMTPQAANALLRLLLQAFSVQNMQAFIGSPIQDYAQMMGGAEMPMGPPNPMLGPPMPQGQQPMGGQPSMPGGMPQMPGMPMMPPMGGGGPLPTMPLSLGPMGPQ